MHLRIFSGARRAAECMGGGVAMACLYLHICARMDAGPTAAVYFCLSPCQVSVP